MTSFNSIEFIANFRRPKEKVVEPKVSGRRPFFAFLKGLQRAFDLLLVATAMAGAYLSLTGYGVLYRATQSSDGWMYHCTYFTPFRSFSVTLPVETPCSLTRPGR